MFCKNCGKEIPDAAFICPNCGVKTNVAADDDGPIGFLGVICFIIPVLGLILYLAWKVDKPNKAHAAGKWALWGFIISAAIGFLFNAAIFSSFANM